MCTNFQASYVVAYTNLTIFAGGYLNIQAHSTENRPGYGPLSSVLVHKNEELTGVPGIGPAASVYRYG
jgi:hypothetical protein